MGYPFGGGRNLAAFLRFKVKVEKNKMFFTKKSKTALDKIIFL